MYCDPKSRKYSTTKINITDRDNAEDVSAYSRKSVRYLGCKQRIQGAVNDKIGIEPPG